MLFHDKYDHFHLKTNSCLCRERKWSPQGYFSPPTLSKKGQSAGLSFHEKVCILGVKGLGQAWQKTGDPRIQTMGLPPTPPWCEPKEAICQAKQNQCSLNCWLWITEANMDTVWVCMPTLLLAACAALPCPRTRFSPYKIGMKTMPRAQWFWEVQINEYMSRASKSTWQLSKPQSTFAIIIYNIQI